MPVDYQPFVKETSTTTGTGNMILAGAVVGFRAFEDAFANFAYVSYSILADNGDFEVGTGQLQYSTTPLIVRSDARVIYSSNSNNRVSFSAGTKTVLCGPMPNHATLNAYRINVDSQSYNDADNLAFDSTVYDPWSAADSTLPTTKLLVPDWAGYMRVTGGVLFGTGNTGKARLVFEKLAGSTYTDPLEAFGCYQNTSYVVQVPVATGWFEPSTYSGESGILIEVDLTTSVNLSGVLTVEWRD